MVDLLKSPYGFIWHGIKSLQMLLSWIYWCDIKYVSYYTYTKCAEYKAYGEDIHQAVYDLIIY